MQDLRVREIDIEPCAITECLQHDGRFAWPPLAGRDADTECLHPDAEDGLLRPRSEQDIDACIAAIGGTARHALGGAGGTRRRNAGDEKGRESEPTCRAHRPSLAVSRSATTGGTKGVMSPPIRAICRTSVAVMCRSCGDAGRKTVCSQGASV